MFKYIVFFFFIAGFAGPLFAEKEEPARPFLFNLKGIYTHPISSKSPLAQAYFDQGMVFFYGYNFGEAARSFQEAARLDPDCAICYFGEALAQRGDIESSKDNRLPIALASAQKAQDLISKATPKEQAYIHALANSYLEHSDSLEELDAAFMEEIEKVAKQYPEDLDAAALYVDAQMGQSPASEQDEIRKSLLHILAKDPNHPGANHYFIHAIEPTSHPEDGLPMAKRLDHLFPFVGHLLHMPAHLYFKTGQYHEASLANERAMRADEDLFAKGGLKGNYYAGFYLHTHQFLIASLIMEGKRDEAQEIAQKVTKILENPNLNLSLYSKNVLPAQRLLILQRFAKGDQILKEPKPNSPFAIGMWHFSKSLAYLAQNNLEQAKLEAGLIQDEPVDNEENGLNTLLSVLYLNAQAAIEEKEGNREKMVQDYQKAIGLEDKIDFSDPPLWFSSSREALGFAYLRAGKSQEAKKMFQEDLEKHPNKRGSLEGLKKADE